VAVCRKMCKVTLRWKDVFVDLKIDRLVPVVVVAAAVVAVVVVVAAAFAVEVVAVVESWETETTFVGCWPEPRWRPPDRCWSCSPVTEVTNSKWKPSEIKTVLFRFKLPKKVTFFTEESSMWMKNECSILTLLTLMGWTGWWVNKLTQFKFVDFQYCKKISLKNMLKKTRKTFKRLEFDFPKNITIKILKI